MLTFSIVFSQNIKNGVQNLGTSWMGDQLNCGTSLIGGPLLNKRPVKTIFFLTCCKGHRDHLHSYLKCILGVFSVSLKFTSWSQLDHTKVIYTLRKILSILFLVGVSEPRPVLSPWHQILYVHGGNDMQISKWLEGIQEIVIYKCWNPKAKL